MKKITVPPSVIMTINLLLAIVLMGFSILFDLMASLVTLNTPQDAAPIFVFFACIVSAVALSLSLVVALKCAKVFDMKFRWTALGLLGKSVIIFLFIVKQTSLHL